MADWTDMTAADFARNRRAIESLEQEGLPFYADLADDPLEPQWLVCQACEGTGENDSAPKLCAACNGQRGRHESRAEARERALVESEPGYTDRELYGKL